MGGRAMRATTSMPGTRGLPIGTSVPKGVSFRPISPLDHFGDDVSLLRVANSRPGEIAFESSHHALNLLIAGESKAHWRTDDFVRDKTMRPGAITLVPAAGTHHMRYQGRSETVRLALAPTRLRAIAEEVRPRLPRVEIRPRLGFHDDMLWRCTLELSQELDRPGIASRIYVDSLLTMLMVRLIRDLPGADAGALAAPKTGLSDKHVRLIEGYVAEHLTEEIDLAVLSGLVGLSRCHFARSFKQKTGRSPYRFVLERRLAQAQALLRDPKMPIAEVAYALGFSSQSHFTTAFRKAIGVTPKAYRQSAL